MTASEAELPQLKLKSSSMFLSAGFYITRSFRRPSYMNKLLLPDHIVSMSSCISKFVPDTWCIEWANDSEFERRQRAEFFDLTEDELFELISSVTPAFGQHFGWPNVIWELGFARSLVAETLDATSDLRILELGLHREFVARFCRDAEPEQHEGFAPVGRHGIHEAILKRRTISDSGIRLGFEPLVSDGTLSHSWLCNGLETVVAEQLHIEPNPWGLIDTFEDARSVASFISRDEIGAEPGLWLPWLIIDHTIGSNAKRM